MLRLLFFFATLLPYTYVNAQKEHEVREENAIQALSFLVGNWAGPGISYGADKSQTPYYDTEYVRFDLDKKLLLINARGERDGKQTYALHTVIYYDVKSGHYWYTPYSGGKPRSFKCALNDKKFICLNKAGDFRLTFQRLKNGEWNEYGQRLANGQWQKTFETILTSKN
ncbi:hypothetical protein [Agarilytica rhodophyticola]|uniref:hypothetical protein n=1 Tax=Agarilytica rhodophyticola TaxID=1737490 RepID=UPI000B3458E6|nr:hypothetical protein [Agarilytica rhodophyticola]